MRGAISLEGFLRLTGFSRLLLLIALVLGGCRELPADRLYALFLDEAPTATDWERALPRQVTVKGGRQHVPRLIPNIDEDTVHATTASCHHGGKFPDPLAVDLRAFYTESDLFLRLSWPDPTEDRDIRGWSFDGERWLNGGNAEDGFGIAWDGGGRFAPFTCAVACHIEDFGVHGDSFHASNRMKLAAEEAVLDLWNWKARRTGRFGFADDRTLSAKGMEGDVPGEIFQENSRARLAPERGLLPFAEGDAPIYDLNGQVVGETFLPPGTTAPGFLTEHPAGSRADVRAVGTWRDGRWTVILRRPLETDDPRDVRFVPGDGQGVAFGLAIMDNTLFEHYASVLAERLVLLAPGAAEREDREQ